MAVLINFKLFQAW